MPLFRRGKHDSDNQPHPLMVLDDRKNRVELWSNKITIHRHGMLNTINVGLTGAKDIYLDTITGIQIKKPGLTTGYIQFAVQGHENKDGVTGAAQDENTVIFGGKSNHKIAEEMKRRIEAMMRQPAATSVGSVSVADEITKLAALRDAGALTDAEFDQQKRSLLE